MITLLFLMNLIRSEPLIESPDLNLVAQKKIEYLCGNGGAKNSATSFEIPNSLYIGENVISSVNSNLARFTSLYIKPNYRKNIQKAEYTKVGMSSGCGYTVQLFSN